MIALKDAIEHGADVYMHVSTHVSTHEELAVLGVLYGRNDILSRFWERHNLVDTDVTDRRKFERCNNTGQQLRNRTLA